jgi:hypothetical protein
VSPLSAIYGSLAVVALIVTAAFHDRRSSDSSRPLFAGLMVLGWAATEASRMAGMIDAWPAMDAVMAAAVALSCVAVRARWKLELVAVLTIQCGLHAVFARFDDGSKGAFATYAAMNNALFVLQLVIVSRDGRRRMQKHVRDRLSAGGHRGIDNGVHAFVLERTEREGVGVNEDDRIQRAG